MNSINKKGVSEVVANVVIIAFTVIVLIVIAQFVIPYVKNNLNKSSECLDYQKYFSFEDSLGYNCKKNGVGYVVSLKAHGQKELEDNIAGLKLVFYENSISVPLEVKNGLNKNQEFFMIPFLNFKVPKTGEVMSYSYNVSRSFNKVEVYTLLKSGRTCETKNDEIILGNCA